MANKEDKNAADTPKAAKPKSLIAAGCEAYGIGEKDLFSAGMHKDDKGDYVLLLTNGGTRVVYRDGMKDIEPLDPISITGINPKPKSKKLTPGPKQEKD